MSKSSRASKKVGRPRTTGPGEQVVVRLHNPLLGAIENWRAKQDDDPTCAEAIRRLVKIALAGGAAPSSTASEMADHEIDKLADASATAEERRTRKRRLLKGPAEFRDIRIDHPATEPAGASKKPAGTKAAWGEKTRQRRS
jgi:hypothetical protein